ncbi:unnamed protein product [Rotaria socialis]|uniref:F-box domain-containing protein n=1 Tax=Rotaria socialis TaxID=392032 RepID=A0A817QR65_9BILA|nr:unnamed protein product [Rotaria socialis]CAF4108925.1 unnamed protein product [Rotaria socialis]
MALITRFGDLSDLVLIELFSYLSSIDILWGFTHLNYRLTTLITERGFFYHINLSFARYRQFNTILRFLPLNDILSISIDNDASPLQLTCWPYMPRLRTLRIISVYDYDDLLPFAILHAATLTHIIVNSNERLVPDGVTIHVVYPLGDLNKLMRDVLLIHLLSLRSLDFGFHYNLMRWPIAVHAPLTYLLLPLVSMDDLIRIMATQQLSSTLRQLHVSIANHRDRKHCAMPTFNSLLPMVNLHTFTFFQKFYSRLRIEWTYFEMLMSSNVMPALRRASLSIFINMNEINRISSSTFFTEHRHVDVHFVFSLINCPQYIEMTQYIPRGNRFHRREIVGATLVVNDTYMMSKPIMNPDHFSYGRQYCHHMWYTLPWAFDEFFHEDMPENWITQIRVFEIPQKVTTSYTSFLRSLDVFRENVSPSLYSLPHVVSYDRIETYHLAYYTTSIPKYLSSLRNITLVNSIDCLTYCYSFPTTIRSIRIHILFKSHNYKMPDWSALMYSLSTLRQLSSLNIFMYDLPTTVDIDNCQFIAKAALNVINFALCFRSKGGTSSKEFEAVFKYHPKFVKTLCDSIILLCRDKQPYYSIENDGFGLKTWF